RDERVHDPLQAAAVELEQRAEQLVGGGARSIVVDGLQPGREGLDAFDQVLAAGRRSAGDLDDPPVHASPVGVCTTFLTRPPPRYMCTPQGRQGSKLRTARMMSMPLNVSGPFSSKMGVFCTASSYGPGVPYTSRG